MAYTAFDQDVQVSSEHIIDAMSSDNAQHLLACLEEHGLSELTAGDWAMLQTWLDVLSDVESIEGNSPLDFVEMGLTSARASVRRFDMGDLPLHEVLRQADRIYQMHHRNGNPGHITPMQLYDTHYIVDASTPYPPTFTYGKLYGYANAFVEDGIDYIVEFEKDDLPDEDDGTVRLHVKWADNIYETA